MTARIMLAIAVSSQFLTGPVLAQGTTDRDMNKHHYQGGPKTSVPHHMTAYPVSKTAATGATISGGHHYSGGPKTESHHMGER